MTNQNADYVSRNEAIGIAQRTRKNLRYIRDAFNRGEDVHVVTQLVTSLLGLIVLPVEEGLQNHVQQVKMDDLYRNCWPKWKITLGDAETLGDLAWHIRNATAHGHISFSSDCRVLSEVIITVKDRPLRQTEFNWEATIGGDELYKFCLRFSRFIEEATG